MKMVLALVFLFASSAYADLSCQTLTRFVGSYGLVSKTCDSEYFGTRLDVNVEDPSSISIYSIDGILVNVSTQPENSIQCAVSGNDLAIQTCPAGGDCLPLGWLYQFSASGLKFSIDGCTATYSRE